jgi:L-seryl-tRNA(Ser) seleniumtransferase
MTDGVLAGSDWSKHERTPDVRSEIVWENQRSVFIDVASELPPAENLTRYVEMGADLVAISGGKIRGPQGTGIL